MSHRKLLFALMILFVVLSLALAACGPTAEPEAPAEEAPPPTEPPPPTDTPEPTAEPTLEPLPPEPQVLQIESFDGTLLDATYYPAAVNPAPVVVMFHQINFGQEQWKAIAPWLQNRGQTAPQAAISSRPLARPALQVGEPWFDSSWFPAIPEGLNVGVVTVTLRDCAGGCNNYSANKNAWIQDGAFSLKYTSELPGVDPDQIFTVGTSIGADDAVDACLIFMEMTGRMCKGAMPVSPGSYLGMPFDTSTKALVGMGTPVLCYAAENDGEAAPACNSVEEGLEGYQKLIVPGNYHGIYAVDPQVEPPWLGPLTDFLVENIVT